MADLGLGALAAFLAGAEVQQTLLGRFGVKGRRAEVPELEEARLSLDGLVRFEDAVQQNEDAVFEFGGRHVGDSSATSGS